MANKEVRGFKNDKKEIAKHIEHKDGVSKERAKERANSILAAARKKN